MGMWSVSKWGTEHLERYLRQNFVNVTIPFNYEKRIVMERTLIMKLVLMRRNSVLSTI